METIKSDNELIAEFMGLKVSHKYGLEVLMPPDNPSAVGHYVRPRYDESWDWLMPVVEKIEAIEGVRFVIEKNRVLVCTYAVQPEYFWNSGTTSQTKLQTTYDAVTEFIKWYIQKSLTS